jgi:hypothetical protein
MDGTKGAHIQDQGLCAGDPSNARGLQYVSIICTLGICLIDRVLLLVSLAMEGESCLRHSASFD